jgi:hypothetical protein
MKFPKISTSAPIANAAGQILAPWIQFFGTFISQPGAFQPLTLTSSPFSFMASENGSILIKGGTVSNVALTRGTATLNMAQSAVPVVMGLGDTITITYTVAPTITFIPG